MDELAAAIVVDSFGRLIPGVLNDETSALTDSFQDDLLAPPVYTRPAEYKGMKVPEILLSGHEAKIDQWRYDQSFVKTSEKRPDLLDREWSGVFRRVRFLRWVLRIPYQIFIPISLRK